MRPWRSTKSLSLKPDQMVTSKTPSSVCALGHTHIPPPKYWPLPTARQVMSMSSRGPSSKETETRRSEYLRSALRLAHLNDSGPPSALEVWFTS